MKFLLDTQALLWFLLDDHRLSGKAREKISGLDALIVFDQRLRSFAHLCVTCRPGCQFTLPSS